MPITMLFKHIDKSLQKAQNKFPNDRILNLTCFFNYLYVYVFILLIYLTIKNVKI